MTCKECEALSGAYVLGAVPAEEYIAVGVHLARCAACTRLYQELHAVVSLLALSVPQMDPPPALKERILEAIQRNAANRRPLIQRVTTRLPSRPLRQRWATRLLASAAVLLLVLLGGMTAWSVSLQGQLSSVSPREVTTIHGLASNSAASGEVVYLPQQHITVLLMRGLPNLTGTHVYQGWLLRDEQPTSVGLLTIQGNTASVSFPGNINGYNGVAISLEPGPTASINVLAGPIVAKGAVNNSS